MSLHEHRRHHTRMLPLTLLLIYVCIYRVCVVWFLIDEVMKSRTFIDMSHFVGYCIFLLISFMLFTFYCVAFVDNKIQDLRFHQPTSHFLIILKTGTSL